MEERASRKKVTKNGAQKQRRGLRTKMRKVGREVREEERGGEKEQNRRERSRSKVCEYQSEGRRVEARFAEALELHSFAEDGGESRQSELGGEAVEIHGELARRWRDRSR
jgi:hypothetical protein